jgi:hypothetical protein
MNNLITVQQDLIEKAWENWLDFHYGLDCDESMDRFCKLVDPGDRNTQTISPWNSDDHDVKVLPEIAARLNMLAGPHYHAYIKAYYATRPWKKIKS